MVDLINQILMERILPSSTCDTRMSIDSSTIAEETSQMVINDGIVNNSSSPSSLFGTSPGKVCGNSKNKSGILVTQDDCLQYLMESYERVSAAEKKYPKVWVYTFSSFFSFFCFLDSRMSAHTVLFYRDYKMQNGRTCYTNLDNSVYHFLFLYYKGF